MTTQGSGWTSTQGSGSAPAPAAEGGTVVAPPAESIRQSPPTAPEPLEPLEPLDPLCVEQVSAEAPAAFRTLRVGAGTAPSLTPLEVTTE
ncbi:hypothetical protein [Streptomyces aurantiacus]|uniref:hypothetical protein n=1 Tax=Streptomyces aurantiacus TaxID=47760 RepID=UPI0012FF0B74|nr:hypothetical protein [Streptomyces aurantiacus]